MKYLTLITECYHLASVLFTVEPCGPLLAGDVIAVMPTGHVWGKRELAHPSWRVFEMADTPVELLSSFFVQRLDEKMLHHIRVFAFDVSDPWIAKVTRKNKLTKLSVEQARRALKTHIARRTAKLTALG